MKLHFLGTGAGGALNCYNTCFTVESNEEYLLVDGGGGNQILKQLKLANIDIKKIHNVFLSHNHTDHILGIIWLGRDVCHKMSFGGVYKGNLNIYGSDESIKVLRHVIELLFPKIKQFEDRIFFNVVENNQILNINNINVKFFDINASKEKQFGLILNEKLVFCGDEPLKENLFSLAKNKEYLIHESLCLDSEKEIYNPYKLGHCTVKDASITADILKVKNLIILHTEDNNLQNRERLYTSEAKKYFSGKIFVPNDLEIIEI